MWTARWLILLLCIFGIVGSLAPLTVAPVNAQSTVRSTGTVTNLFATVDPGQSFNGARIDLPQGWDLEEVRLLRYGTEPVSIQTQQSEPGSVVLTTDRIRHGPHELVLRVRMGESPGSYQWRLTPFVQSPEKEAEAREEARQLLTSDRVTRQVHVEEASRPTGENRVLDLRKSSSPLLLPAQTLPSLGRLHAFTVEFWMRTSGLDEVILSTWNGNEAVAYAVEFTVDRSGRLRFYSGQPGQHQALRTKTPVADDRWHHVAITYDTVEPRLRLLLDGTVADSVQPRALPQAPGPVPMAIGGRIRSQSDSASVPLYSGHLDEVRIWEGTRSTEELRTMRKRPFSAQEGDDTGQRPVRLSFDEETTPNAYDWPEGAQRVSTTLSFHSVLRNLRADTQDRTVTLRWEADLSEEGVFVVERTSAQSSFTPVARLRPEEAALAPSDPSDFSYTDENVEEQVVFYRIRHVEQEGEVEHTSGTIKIGLGTENEDSSETKLLGNFPNPFTESTTIAYEVHEAQPVTLTVWNLAGHRVATLADETHDPGYHEKTLNAEDLPSGTYFARLQTPTNLHSHRMVVLR